MKPEPVQVIANGERRRVVAPCSVETFLLQHGWKSTQVVVEYNGAVLAREKMPTTNLADGDQLEIIVPVAGG